MALGGLAAIATPSSAVAQNWTEREVTGSASIYGDFPDSTWICALTGVKGYFGDHDRDGGREYVMMRHINGQWQLEGGSGRTARMACTRISNFTRPSGSVSWIGGMFGLAQYDRNANFNVSTNLWWGDAASMIGFMSGEFEGQSDFIQINQNTNASAASTLQIASHSGDLLSNTDMESGAYSIFLGNPDNHLPVRLIGYNSGGAKARGNAGTAGTFEMAVSTQSGFSSFWLADTSGSLGGLCYFTKVAGDFNGGGESAVITEASATWKLSVVAGGGNVSAKARCMAYDQR